jgi:hypothetical protein
MLPELCGQCPAISIRENSVQEYKRKRFSGCPGTFQSAERSISLSNDGWLHAPMRQHLLQDLLELRMVHNDKYREMANLCQYP